MHSHAHELTLGLAFGLGALHALEPGHGKTAMLAYFASERGSLFHPVVAGVSSAISHSVSLMAIAAMVHLTHHMITGDHHHHNEAVTTSMQWISAGLIVIVGLWMLVSAWRATPTKCGCGAHHEHGHISGTGKSATNPFANTTAASDCDATNAQEAIAQATETKPKTGAGYSRSALLGIAFGLLPCPSALAAYFTSMSEGTPVAAYAVIGLFAAGIATSLSITGIVMQTLGQRLARREWKLPQLPWAYIRGGMITCVGLIYLARVASMA